MQLKLRMPVRKMEYSIIVSQKEAIVYKKAEKEQILITGDVCATLVKVIVATFFQYRVFVNIS